MNHPLRIKAKETLSGNVYSEFIRLWAEHIALHKGKGSDEYAERLYMEMSQ